MNEETDAVEKFKLFRDLAIDIFPPDSWENWEIKALKRLGLLRYFGLEEDDSDTDFDTPFGGYKTEKDDWL